MTNLLKNILLFAALSASFQLFSVRVANSRIWTIRYISEKKIDIIPTICGIQYHSVAFSIECPQGYLFVPEQHERQGLQPFSNGIIIAEISIHRENINAYRVYNEGYTVALGQNPSDINLDRFFESYKISFNNFESQQLYFEGTDSDSKNNDENDTENKAKYFLRRNKKSIISGVTGFVLGIVGLKLFQEIKKSKKNKPKKETSK